MRASAAYPFVAPGGGSFRCVIDGGFERDGRVLTGGAAPDPADVDTEGYARSSSMTASANATAVPGLLLVA